MVNSTIYSGNAISGNSKSGTLKKSILFHQKTLRLMKKAGMFLAFLILNFTVISVVHAGEVVYTASHTSGGNNSWVVFDGINVDCFNLTSIVPSGVEKSRNGQTWSIVGEQAAAGNSNTILNYNFVDENSWNATSYYRLRQIDFNGAEEIYGPISVSCKGNESSMTVYPNPNSGSFTIEIASTEMYNDAQLFLTDLTGKVITSQAVNVANGTTQILIDNLDLKMGTYLVTLRGADQQLKPVKLVVTK